MVKLGQIWDLFWSRENRIANSLDVARDREIFFFFWFKQLGAIYWVGIY